MAIKGCPRENDRVSKKDCEGCDWLSVGGETAACTLGRSGGGGPRGRRLPVPCIDVSRTLLPGEESWFPPLPTGRDESHMPSQEAPPGLAEDEKASRWKRMFLDEKLAAVEDSVVKCDPTLPLEPPDMMDLVEASIEGKWVSPWEEPEESPPETSPDIEGLPMDPGPTLPRSPVSPTPPGKPLPDDPFLNPEQLTDLFGRPLPPLPDETDDEFGPGLP